jgi:hypothetical protein
LTNKLKTEASVGTSEYLDWHDVKVL